MAYKILSTCIMNSTPAHASDGCHVFVIQVQTGFYFGSVPFSLMSMREINFSYAHTTYHKKSEAKLFRSF